MADATVLFLLSADLLGRLQIDGKKGNWIATDTIIIDGKQFYLMEHQVYRDQAQGVILDAYGKMVVEECKKFDEKTKQKIHDYIQQVRVQLFA